MRLGIRKLRTDTAHGWLLEIFHVEKGQKEISLRRKENEAMKLVIFRFLSFFVRDREIGF